MLVCTILPTYNERDNIVLLIERLLACTTYRWVVLVVDDNSPDGTCEAVEELAARHNSSDRTQITLIRRRGEKGLTSALQRGIDTAINTWSADIITWMDCDLSMPPEDMQRLVSGLTHEHADVVVGSRWIRGGSDRAHGMIARAMSWIINLYARALLSIKIHDYTSGFVAARSDVLRQIRLRGDYGEYCIDFLFRALRSGFRVQEMPYVCVPRKAGVSKTGVNIWEYLVKGRKYVSTVWQLRREF